MSELIQEHVDAIQGALWNAEAAQKTLDDGDLKDALGAALKTVHDTAKAQLDAVKAQFPDEFGGVALRAGGDKTDS